MWDELRRGPVSAIYQCHSGSRDSAARVSCYHSPVSMPVGSAQFDPDPVSLPFPTPPPARVCQYLTEAQNPTFPGTLAEFLTIFLFGSPLFVPREARLYIPTQGGR